MLLIVVVVWRIKKRGKGNTFFAYMQIKIKKSAISRTFFHFP